MLNMFKVNNKNTKTIIVNFEHIFTPFSSVSIVNFKQVNVSWVSKMQILPCFYFVTNIITIIFQIFI